MPDAMDELKTRILNLEEEKEALKKSLENRADKTTIAQQIAEITAQISEVRKELSELKKPKEPLRVKANEPSPESDDPSAGFWD